MNNYENRSLTNNSNNNKNCGTYCFKDSCLMFVLALFLPYIAYFTFIIVVTIFLGNTFLGKQILFGTSANYILAIICQVSLIGAVYVLTKNKKANILKANNVSFKLDYVKVLIVLAIGFISLFGFNGLSNLTTYVLSQVGYKVSATSLASYGVNNIGMLLLIVFCLAALPAICEEFTMRGVILNGFIKKGKNFAILISALMFMIMHLSLEQSIYQFVLGVILATIVYYSGNILYSIILHFANNAIILILNYATSSVSVEPLIFSTFTDYFLPIIIAIIACVILFFLIKLFILRCKKTNCINLSEKLKNEEIEKNKTTSNNLEQLKNVIAQENNTQATQDIRDLPKHNHEILSNKTALILSLAIGIITWILLVVVGFVV